MLIALSAFLGTTILLNLLLGGVVWWRDVTFDLTGKLFASFLFFDALWAAGIFFVINQPAQTYLAGSPVYVVMQLLFFAVCCWNILKIIFYRKVIIREKVFQSLGDYLMLGLFFVSAGGALVPGGLFTDITVSGTGYAELTRSGVNGLFGIYILFGYFYSIYLLWQKKQHAPNGLLRRQIALLLWSHTIFLGMSVFTNLVLSNMLHIYQFNALGPTFTLLSLAVYTYLVTHYRFLDIRLNLQRALTYTSAGFVTIGAIAAVVLHIPSESPYLLIFANVATLLTCAVLFSPLLKLLNAFFNIVVYGRLRNYRDELRDAVESIHEAGLSLAESSHQLLAVLAATLGLQNCRLVPLPAFAATQGMDGETLFRERDLLYADELASEADLTGDERSRGLATMMRSEGIAVLAPVMRGNACLGAIATTGKANGEPLTSDELEEIRHIADSAAAYLTGEAHETDIVRHEARELEHYVNTPLARMELKLHQLREDPKLAAKHRAELGDISREVFTISRTFRYFFELEQIAEYGPLLHDVADIAAAVEYAHTHIDAELAKSGVATPTIKQKGRTSGAVRGNTFVLGSLLVELLANAARFGSGGITLEIVPSDETVAIRVTSRGHLTSEQCQTATQKFGVVHPDRSGSGLGLAYVQAFAEGMRRTFRLTSTPRTVIAEIILLRS